MSELVRRRFYLSKESLDYINKLAEERGMTASVLLDTILIQMKINNKENR